MSPPPPQGRMGLIDTDTGFLWSNACNYVQISAWAEIELGHAQRSSCECKTLSCKHLYIHFTRAEIRYVIARTFLPGLKFAL